MYFICMLKIIDGLSVVSLIVCVSASVLEFLVFFVRLMCFQSSVFLSLLSVRFVSFTEHAFELCFMNVCFLFFISG